MKVFYGLIIGIVFGTNIAWANTYTSHVQLKKQIIKAIFTQVDPDYLSRIEDPVWQDPNFYNGVTPVSGITGILNETSGFVPVGGHSFVLDGDKVLNQEGVFLDDIPGHAVVVYDKKRSPNNQSIIEIYDADRIQVEGGNVLAQIFRGGIAIFDCLIPGNYVCDVP